eukprot:Awhi_evm1s1758
MNSNFLPPSLKDEQDEKEELENNVIDLVAESEIKPIKKGTKKKLRKPKGDPKTKDFKKSESRRKLMKYNSDEEEEDEEDEAESHTSGDNYENESSEDVEDSSDNSDYSQEDMN